MTHMSDNEESSSRDFGDSSKCTNQIVDLGETCHIKQQVPHFIPRSLEDKDKYIEIADGNHVTTKQEVQLRTKCATIMEILLSQCCTVYFLHQIYATSYFQLSR